ncbi:MAG: hypothetical protein HZA16_11665 [Nitrospirae bacterium]|nr:hypothetical protein [Nitrospirota bacterium]
MRGSKSGPLTVVLCIILVLVSYTIAMSHTDVTVRDSSGNPVSGNTPYSPKQTCATAGCHNYGSDPVTASKVQGYANSSGKVAFQNYDVTTFSHGVSVGKHSNQGRGEEWTAALRTVWGAPGFTSSPGMFGRY